MATCTFARRTCVGWLFREICIGDSSHRRFDSDPSLSHEDIRTGDMTSCLKRFGVHDTLRPKLGFGTFVTLRAGAANSKLASFSSVSYLEMSTSKQARIEKRTQGGQKRSLDYCFLFLCFLFICFLFFHLLSFFFIFHPRDTNCEALELKLLLRMVKFRMFGSMGEGSELSRRDRGSIGDSSFCVKSKASSSRSMDAMVGS